MDFNEIKLQPNPLLKANLISKLLYIWIFPFMWKGTKKDLSLSDVYSSLPEDSCENLGDSLEKEWRKELKRAKLEFPKGHPKLMRAITKMIWKRFCLVGLGYCFDELFLRLLQPIILRKFIRTFTENEDEYSNLKRDQYFYAALLVLLSLSHALLFHTLLRTSLYIGLQMRVAVSALIFRKTLRLRKSDSENTNVGKLCNLLSNDVMRFQRGFYLLHYLYISSIQVLLYGYLLWDAMGWSSLGGICCILSCIPIQLIVARFAMYFRTRIATATDKRGHCLSEIISGIRLIKMHAWEKPFSKLVSKLRKFEIFYVRRTLYLRGVLVSLEYISQKLSPFCTLILYVGVGNTLTAEKAFYSIAIFGILQSIMIHLPGGASQLGEMIASARRVEAFLMAEESHQIEKAESVEPAIKFENYSGSWNEKQETLKNIQANLKRNKLIIIAGHVGSGKTSFLHAILSELPIILSGHCSVQGRLSYASQEAWIFPASLRQNILFDLEMDAERYWKTIKMCSLQNDLDKWSDGDLTLVGEKGVVLSGGQKARVNLARAIYQDADIYLFDDPLSAVDAKVGKLLFNGIKEELRDKMRILVTHQLQYLPMADDIIVLNREGGIWFQGSYDELKASKVDFTSLITNDLNSANGTAEVFQVKSESVKHDGENKLNEKSNLLTSRRNKEEKSVGSVGLKTYIDYFKSGVSYLSICLIFVGAILTQFLYNFLDYWLSLWTRSSPQEQIFYTDVYCVVTALFILLAIFRSVLFFQYCMKISVNIHDKVFSSLVRAPVKFFDDNPSGRIMNRFTKDLNQMDETLPVVFNDFFEILLMVSGMLIINLGKMRSFYLATGRDLKRISAIAKSPVFTHATMTAQGLTTIRGLRAQKRVLDHFERLQDVETSACFMELNTNRWFAIWLEILSCVYMACVCFGFLLLTTSSEGGSVGMAISAILSFGTIMQYGIRQSAELENCMTSVERAFEYCNLKPEAPLKVGSDKLLDKDWPNEGKIEFRDVSLSYDIPPENYVLKNITFSTKAGEKIGIVGRTGAGKSSIITALFRMTEVCGGNISIDGVKIKDLGLHTLRSRISIIPQDPVLFSGSLRYNLDPFNEFGDNELWCALEEVELNNVAKSLDYQVADGGQNFSTGQRQLVCLARALLRKNRVIVLDEPTANIDPVTDQMVQKTIREKFSECTILTIAHRIQSVLDNDRIIVVDQGKILEFDKPELLAVKANGFFSTC